jgi:CheY-like chemotaxis protein
MAERHIVELEPPSASGVDGLMALTPKTILIAEDEISVRVVAAAMLSDAGFDVIEADHAEAALTILGSRAADVALLFTDITMPGELTGLNLSHHVRQVWPQIALLITSGDKRPQPEELPRASLFLPKPYTPDLVEAQVRALLAA